VFGCVLARKFERWKVEKQESWRRRRRRRRKTRARWPGKYQNDAHAGKAGFTDV
jgi:hypothetical protein